MCSNIFILNIIFYIAVLSGWNQYSNDRYPEQQSDTAFRILFYNVENLFDTYNDSITDDDDFTPAGDLHWTRGRYQTKLNNISKVIIAAGQWQNPAIIGLCEIENKKVLEDLIYRTSLSAFSYRIVHKESPDRRGIDVALLYNYKKFRVVESRFFSVLRETLATRDILYVQLMAGKEPFHVFVNHWPSRSEGQLESEAKRIAAATILRQVTDSVLGNNPSASVIIMGDFNDEPHDKSIADILQCGRIQDNSNGKLVNLTMAPTKGNVQGTLKYQGTWNVFDQIMVSGNLLYNRDGPYIANNSFGILNNPFLLEKDQTFTGFKPYRTYIGYRYVGGFSDHLPVYADVITGNR